MQFTKLKLTGFKSFVDPTELWIEPGLTGVVGPNGCGKSNLVEAIRWVMGETSAKQMRGGGMEDVIFGGTDRRPARNIAEVTLEIDNAERDAPAQYNTSDELDITRRIERGDGSNYSVNGTDVRARDVQTLFADAASGARSTALVSQGRIGALIAAKPTDRRHLLEEAAGITGLHSRRHEAELRLRAAETNLERLDDVLGALEEQLKALKKQARQATRYRNLSDHIRRAEAIAIHHQWTEATSEKSAAMERMSKAEDAVADLTQKVASATTVQTEAANAVPALRDAEAREAASLQRLVIARNELEQEEKRIEAERLELINRIAQIKGDRDREISLKEDAEAALERLKNEIEALEIAEQNQEQDIADANEALSAANAEVSRLEQNLTDLSQGIASDETRQEALNRRISESEVRRSRIAQRLEELSAERETAEATIDEQGAGAEFTLEMEKLRNGLDDARKALEDTERDRHTALKKENEARVSLQEVETKRARLKAEEEALEALLTVGDPDLWPPMIDALSVEPGYELALAIALGDDLNAPTDEAAPIHWRALSPFSAPDSLPSGAVPLSNVVSAPRELARRLSQIGIVDTEATGNALAGKLTQGQRLVSRDGGLWRWDGYTVVGEASEGSAARLTQRNRLKDLHAEVDRAARIVADASEKFEERQKESERATNLEQAAREAVRNADQAFQDIRDREAAQNRTLSEARSKIASAVENAEVLRADDAEMETAIEQAQRDLAGLTDIPERRQAATKLRAELSEARTTATERQSAYDRLVGEAGSRRQRMSDMAEARESWSRRADNATEQIEALLQRLEIAETALQKVTARPEEITIQRTELFEQISLAEKSRDEAADTLAEGETKLAAAGKALREIEARLAEAREERVRCEAIQEQVDQSMAVIAERCAERVKCTPDQALEEVGVADDDKLPTRDAIEVRVERLKRERENMGAVNLRAEAEAEELDERIQVMLSEREDLISAIARLRQGIANLNREGRTRLLAAFEEVNTHFGKLFTRLYGGGKAHLALTEAEDPLEAGLEIMASPPGKKMQTLSLLSGGEQALTAIALLFAVFLTNPAPICVLDEVDAPLDDANVERFCQLISEIARQTGTRFLIVTHHRLTMARMDRLFGVTMSERGVSQLVSVDLQAAEELRESA
ncbi:MAG: chromosome segregation protein SMC [Rhodospirillaceae bacterium]|nr:chromosome segregation protein SMC [Rhodospirillaceae bacterium]